MKVAEVVFVVLIVMAGISLGLVYAGGNILYHEELTSLVVSLAMWTVSFFGFCYALRGIKEDVLGKAVGGCSACARLLGYAAIALAIIIGGK